MSLIALKSDIKATPRILQIRGMFDLDDKHGTTTNIKHQDITLDKQWNVGLIVGPSGSGKSTVAQQHFDLTGHTLNNIETTAVVDHFPEDMTTDEATALLSSVGFSSPPTWLRPLTQLS